MTLYVKNISFNVKQDRLQRAFSKFGEVHVDLKKGFAFAEFVDKRDAEEALDNLQGANFSGMNINIKVRTTTQEHPCMPATRVLQACGDACLLACSYAEGRTTVAM